MSFSLFFAHLCFAADGPALFFNVTGSSSSVTVSTVATNHTYPAAGIKIKTPGYQLSGVGSECTMGNTGYCIFSVSDTTPKTFSISGSGDALEIALCLNGNGPISCQDYSIGTSRVANALYVINYALGDFANNSLPPVMLCPFDPSSQLIASCDSAFAPSSTFEAPRVQSIVLNDAGDKAYISVSEEDYFYQCDVDTSTQLLSNCNHVNFRSPDFYSTHGLTILSPTGDYGYFVDSGIPCSNQVTELGDSCSNHTNTVAGTLLACSITDGNMSGDNCSSIGMSIYEYAVGIAFNQLEGQNYIYVANNDDRTVATCTLTSSTSVGTCNNISGGGAVAFGNPVGLAFNPVNHLLYVADNTGQVYACDSTQASVSAFTNCQAASSMTELVNAWGIIFNSQGTVAYISTYGDSVFQCPINQTDGITFDECTTQSGFSSSVGLALGYK